MGCGQPVDEDDVGEFLEDCDGHDWPIARGIGGDQQKKCLEEQGYREEAVEVFGVGDGRWCGCADAIAKKEKRVRMGNPQMPAMRKMIFAMDFC